MSPPDLTSPARGPTSEWDARTYTRISNPQFAWGLKVLERLPLSGHETVLDAGCGSGRLTALLVERLPHGRVIALDGSQNMLDEARGHLAPRFGDRVEYVRADLQNLDLPPVADVVFSTATFHWVKDHARLFQGLLRALKPGGRLHAQCGGGPILARFHRHAYALMASEPFAPHFAGWTDSWFYADVGSSLERLARAGFEEPRAWLEEVPTGFASGAELAEFLRSVVCRAHLARLPDEALRSRFLKELVDVLAKDDPPLTLDYWRLNLEGRKPAAS